MGLPEKRLEAVLLPSETFMQLVRLQRRCFVHLRQPATPEGVGACECQSRHSTYTLMF